KCQSRNVLVVYGMRKRRRERLVRELRGGVSILERKPILGGRDVGERQRRRFALEIVQPAILCTVRRARGASARAQRPTRADPIFELARVPVRVDNIATEVAVVCEARERMIVFAGNLPGPRVPELPAPLQVGVDRGVIEIVGVTKLHVAATQVECERLSTIVDLRTQPG